MEGINMQTNLKELGHFFYCLEIICYTRVDNPYQFYFSLAI